MSRGWKSEVTDGVPSGGVKLPRGIAPHLRWHISFRLKTFPDVDYVQAEAAQLRALLACVRALAAIPHLDGCPASGFDAPETPCTCPHKRALARLRGAPKQKNWCDQCGNRLVKGGRLTHACGPGHAVMAARLRGAGKGKR